MAHRHNQYAAAFEAFVRNCGAGNVNNPGWEL